VQLSAILCKRLVPTRRLTCNYINYFAFISISVLISTFISISLDNVAMNFPLYGTIYFTSHKRQYLLYLSGHIFRTRINEMIYIYIYILIISRCVTTNYTYI
jgi:hypothetical protein